MKRWCLPVLVLFFAALGLQSGRATESWQQRFTVIYDVDENLARHLTMKEPEETKKLTADIYDLSPYFINRGAQLQLGDFILLDLNKSELIIVNHSQQIELIEDLARRYFQTTLVKKTEPVENNPALLFPFSSPTIQSKKMHMISWKALGEKKQNEIKNYLYGSLGLSDTGFIQLVGVYKEDFPANKPALTFFQFQHLNWFGCCLSWSVLIEPESMTSRIIYHHNQKEISDTFSPMSQNR